MKNGPAIPSWAVGVALGVFVIVLAFVGYKYIMGAGPVDPASLPADQTRNPYMNSDFGKKMMEKGGHPTNPHP